MPHVFLSLSLQAGVADQEPSKDCCSGALDNAQAYRINPQSWEGTTSRLLLGVPQTKAHALRSNQNVLVSRMCKS